MPKVIGDLLSINMMFFSDRRYPFLSGLGTGLTKLQSIFVLCVGAFYCSIP